MKKTKDEKTVKPKKLKNSDAPFTLSGKITIEKTTKKKTPNIPEKEKPKLKKKKKDAPVKSEIPQILLRTEGNIQLSMRHEGLAVEHPSIVQPQMAPILFPDKELAKISSRHAKNLKREIRDVEGRLDRLRRLVAEKEQTIRLENQDDVCASPMSSPKSPSRPSTMLGPSPVRQIVVQKRIHEPQPQQTEQVSLPGPGPPPPAQPTSKEPEQPALRPSPFADFEIGDFPLSPTSTAESMPPPQPRVSFPEFDINFRDAFKSILASGGRVEQRQSVGQQLPIELRDPWQCAAREVGRIVKREGPGTSPKELLDTLSENPAVLTLASRVASQPQKSDSIAPRVSVSVPIAPGYATNLEFTSREREQPMFMPRPKPAASSSQSKTSFGGGKLASQSQLRANSVAQRRQSQSSDSESSTSAAEPSHIHRSRLSAPLSLSAVQPSQRPPQPTPQTASQLQQSRWLQLSSKSLPPQFTQPQSPPSPQPAPHALSKSAVQPQEHPTSHLSLHGGTRQQQPQRDRQPPESDQDATSERSSKQSSALRIDQLSIGSVTSPSLPPSTQTSTSSRSSSPSFSTSSSSSGESSSDFSVGDRADKLARALKGLLNGSLTSTKTNTSLQRSSSVGPRATSPSKSKRTLSPAPLLRPPPRVVSTASAAPQKGHERMTKQERTKTLRNAFWGWKVYLNHRRRCREHNDRAASFFASRALQKSLRTWRVEHCERVIRRENEKAADAMITSNLTRKYFGAWIRKARAILALRSAFQRVEQHRYAVVPFTVWRDWAGHRCEVRQKGQLLKAVRLEGSMRGSFLRWKALVAERERERLADEAHDRHVLANSLHKLHLYARKKVLKRTMQEYADSFYRHTLCTVVFEALRDNVGASKAERHYNRSLQSQTFLSWRVAVLEDKASRMAQNRYIASADARRERVSKSTSFHAWREWTQRKKRLRRDMDLARFLHCRRSQQKCFSAWRQYISTRKLHRECNRTAMSFATRSLAIRALNRWIDAYNWRQDSKDMWTAACQHYDRSVARSSFRSWKQWAGQLTVTKASLADTFYERCSLGHCFSAWRTFVRWGKLYREATGLSETRLLSRHFEAWKVFTVQECSVRKARAQRFSRLRILRPIFAAWRVYAANERRQNELVARHRARKLHFLVVKAFLAWRLFARERTTKRFERTPSPSRFTL